MSFYFVSIIWTLSVFRVPLKFSFQCIFFFHTSLPSFFFFVHIILLYFAAGLSCASVQIHWTIGEITKQVNIGTPLLFDHNNIFIPEFILFFSRRLFVGMWLTLLLNIKKNQRTARKWIIQYDRGKKHFFHISFLWLPHIYIFHIICILCIYTRYIFQNWNISFLFLELITTQEKYLNDIQCGNYPHIHIFEVK